MSDVNTLLSQKVAEQTDEIRKSYEAEKQARQELEKLNDAKDQFIMITQHHLRTPLVSVIWEIESVANGVYGAVTAELRKAIAGMKTSTDRLMQIVNDFLNITAIKIGTNILNLSEQSLKPAIEYIIQQLAPEIRHMDIKIDYPRDDSSWPKLKIDYDKMREILLIVIENAVRYNHPGGSVAISTGVSDGAFELTVQNTGIGISDEEKQKIGSALFYRGASARKSHPIGMGIGLAVVKAIVRAHHGTFNIESLGEGRGAKATISLPVQ
ncbi:MAG: HAMP domain-containing sensor histidine kinase [Candidatus Paceibacterota bacterium]